MKIMNAEVYFYLGDFCHQGQTEGEREREGELKHIRSAYGCYSSVKNTLQNYKLGTRIVMFPNRMRIYHVNLQFLAP